MADNEWDWFESLPGDAQDEINLLRSIVQDVVDATNEAGGWVRCGFCGGGRLGLHNDDCKRTAALAMVASWQQQSESAESVGQGTMAMMSDKSVTVYCFVNAVTQLGQGNEFDRDVHSVAVCGECRKVLASHTSSNEDWAHHDIMRPYHVKACQEHASEQHSAESVQMIWLDKPWSHER